MQIHKIKASHRSKGANLTQNPKELPVQVEDHDAFWEVAPDYPDHLLKRPHPSHTKPTSKAKTKTNATAKATSNTNKMPNTNKSPSLAQPHEPTQRHPYPPTKLHVATNAQNGKKVVEKLKVPIVTNQPPVPTPPAEKNNKNVITTNKYLSHSNRAKEETVPNKEYQHTRYADDTSNRQQSSDPLFTVDLNEAVRSAVSTFDQSPLLTSSFRSSSPSRISRLPHHDKSQFLYPPSQFLSHPSQFSSQPSQFLSPTSQFLPAEDPRVSRQPQHQDTALEDVEFEEELLNQRALKLQEDIERLRVKKSIANLQKFEEDLRTQKQIEYERLEEACKHNLETKLFALFQEKEKSMIEYKAFQLSLEEKMSQLQRVQAELSAKIQTLENSYLECAEMYKRECYEVLVRERANIESDFATQLSEWKLRHMQ